MPEIHEEKNLSTWGLDVPDDLVLDKKRLTDALKKVLCSQIGKFFGAFYVFLINTQSCHAPLHCFPLKIVG